MSKPLIISILFLTVGIILAIAPYALAQDLSPEVAEAIEADEQVSASDLGIEEPTILPTSKLYFLKNWARSIQTVFTFGPVKKAELKLKFASEKLLEAKKVAEKETKPELVEKAAANYQKEVEAIKTTVDKIKEKATENTAVGKFLDKFTQQQILHEKILEKLAEQVPEAVIEKIQTVRDEHLQRFGEVMEKLEEKTKIAERLKKNLKEMQGSEFKPFQDMQILKRLEEKASEAIKETIQEVRENKLEELKEKLEEMPEAAREKFKEYAEKIQGVAETKMEIIEDIKLKLQDRPAIKQNLENVREKIIEKIKENREDEETGIKCPPLSKMVCQGRMIVEKDENRCPVSRCVILGEENIKEQIPSQEAIQPGLPETRTACITLWDPVCGADGKTYSNKCWAGVAGVQIIQQGECSMREKETNVNE